MQPEGTSPHEAQPLCLQVLADEVKLTASGIGFTSQGGRLRGVVTTVVDGCTDAHVLYRTLAPPPDTVPIAKYALCLSLRCLARPAVHAIFAFVLTEGNISADFTVNLLLSAVTVVQSHDMSVFGIIMDGSSVNIKAFKMLLGGLGAMLWALRRLPVDELMRTHGRGTLG